MIGKLKGLVDEIYKDHIIIDVGGVGYLVYCSTSTISKVKSKSEASLIVETHVREDQISLYGFISNLEREWFKKLVTVKGVGNKLALAILGVISEDNLYNVFLSSDKEVLSSVPGVGPRLSERIISELKNIDISFISNNSSGNNNATSGNLETTDILSDTVSVLHNLGYSRSESYKIAAKLLKDEGDLDMNNLIRKSLKELAR